jgi:hypothetical protein
MFNPLKEEMQMKTMERLAPWITPAFEVTLFTAATVVLASGIFVMFLRPAMVLA